MLINNIVHIDTRDCIGSSADSFSIQSPSVFQNVRRVELLSMEFTHTQDLIDETNDSISWMNEPPEDASGAFYGHVQIPHASYSIASFCETITRTINDHYKANESNIRATVAPGTSPNLIKWEQSETFPNKKVTLCYETEKNSIVWVSHPGHPFCENSEVSIDFKRKYLLKDIDLSSVRFKLSQMTTNGYAISLPNEIIRAIIADGEVDIRRPVPFTHHSGGCLEFLGFPRCDMKMTDRHHNIIEGKVQKPSLAGPNYIYLTSPQLSVTETARVNDIFAKVRLNAPPSSVLFDSHVPSSIDFDTPRDFSRLDFAFVHADGRPVDSGRTHHSFSLRVEMMKSRDDEVRRGIGKRARFESSPDKI